MQVIACMQLSVVFYWVWLGVLTPIKPDYWNAMTKAHNYTFPVNYLSLPPHSVFYTDTIEQVIFFTFFYFDHHNEV